MRARQLPWGDIVVGLAGIALLVLVPRFAPIYVQLQFALYFAFAILALSLAFIWGYVGVFSFGQAAFFGLGGYTYAIVAINMGGSTLAVLAGLAVPAVFAAMLGYFMFYGRLNSVYLAVITLVVTLLFFKFLGHTAGFEYRIGQAALGGYNGIPAIPPLNLPWDVDRAAAPEDMFVIAGICVLLTYFGLRWLLGTRFGRICVGIRENELRIGLLGFDVRLFKTIAFAIAALIAAVGGIMFTNWNAFIDPHVFSLGTSAQIIIWVVVGGLGTLIGPVLGAIALGLLTVQLGTQQQFDVNLILGAVLTIFVLLVPQGIWPVVRRVCSPLAGAAGRRGEAQGSR